MALLSKTDLANPESPIYPLSQFVLQYPRLKMGIDLLPSAVELYQWLHTELTYAVTYDEAATITLGRLAKVSIRHLSDDTAMFYENFKSKNLTYVTVHLLCTLLLLQHCAIVILN